MEILIVVAIMAVVTKRGVEDILHTARGGTPHRYTAARRPGGSGAWGRYRRALVDDVATDLLQRHNERRARRAAEPMSKVEKPRGAATQFFAGLTQDARRAARRRWNAGWDGLDERRRTKATRPRPGQVTVPGTVVPNAQDERQDEDGRPHQDRPQDGPQDEDRPDPATVPTQDDRTDLQFGDDPTDPTGTKTCPECHGTSITQDGICLACRDRQEQRNQHHDTQTNSPLASPTTQEGTTMTTTIPTDVEVIGLDPAITYCDTTVQACKAMIHSLERTEAAIKAGGVTGVAAAAFAEAREKFGVIATVMEGAGNEFIAHKAIQEQYAANPGAGSKEFITAGR